MAVDGFLFFAANNGVHGAELWASDGTPAGTWMYADLNPQAANGFLLDDGYQMYNINGSLYFAGNEGIHGNELWMLAFCRQHSPAWLW